ncbi:retropepsin-like aspartic protease [Tenacibaculum sp. 190524A02b]
MNKILLYIMLCVAFCMQSQSKFNFLKGVHKQDVRFKMVNNLIVVPINVNGKELSFILDTGVNKTVLFNLTQNDSITLNNKRKIFIKGLGEGEPAEAILSRGNRFRIENLLGTNQEVFVILHDEFNLSAKMGVTINGIIGYDLLKDVVLKINYTSEKLTFYKPSKYKEPRCRSCERLKLEFYKKKPYIDVGIQVDEEGNFVPVKMLVDSGGSDAMWLFEGSNREIKTPEKFFVDILGVGLSGTIYGKRSRINTLKLGKFKIKKPTVSFLDTLATKDARKFGKRNGSIGGNVLSRFKVWVDYPNKKIMLKKSGSLTGFYYNMSGLHVVHDGLELVKLQGSSLVSSVDKDSFGGNRGATTKKVISFVTSYSYKFRPSYKIESVVKDSPAFRAGIEKDDIILSINGKPFYEYTLETITSLFQLKPNKKIKMVVKRGIVELKYEFRLEPRI